MDSFQMIADGILNFRSRLIERQLFLTLFQGEDISQAIKAILAYQNPDGGFGNGIEPDLNTPDSTGIALETALYYFDCLGFIPRETAGEVIGWIRENLCEEGYLSYPPESLELYPHQPWWNKKDDNRVLAVIALLIKLKVEVPRDILKKTDILAEALPCPEELQEYDYPLYLYSLYHTGFARWDEVLKDLELKFPRLIQEKAGHHILFTRYWKFFRSFISHEQREQEALRFYESLDNRGLLPSLYPDLPWWDSIFTLDGLIALKEDGLLKE